jgi:hypothetical protein|tara:strand:- start:713 stop:1009 length:297 start_codon:yes stop_codon:yes gene_type:complete
MKNKTKSYIKLFTNAIKKSDEALVFDIEINESSIEDGEDGEEFIYFEFLYQIDDRIDRDDNDVKVAIKKEIGDKYGVSIDRMDAFTNGYAAYKVTIDS